MNCQMCDSERVVSISAKCGYSFSASIGLVNDENHYEIEGCVPIDLGIGDGKYIKFDLCLDCGQLQGKFPRLPSEMEKSASDEDVVEYYQNNFIENGVMPIGAMIDYHVNYAEDLGSKFQTFLKKFLLNGRQPSNTSWKFPSASKFLEMFKSNYPYLGEEF